MTARTVWLWSLVLVLAFWFGVLLLAKSAFAATITCDVGLICYGTSSGDVMYGTSQGDQMYGYGGNDSMDGLGSDDSMFGGDGADNVYGDVGTNHLHGGPGNDTLWAYQNTCAPQEFDGAAGYDTARYRAGAGNTFNSVENRIKVGQC